MRWRIKATTVFYLLIFFTPLIFNPWGGPNAFEAVKQSWIFFIIGIVSIWCAYRLLFSAQVKIVFNKSILLVLGLWIFSFGTSTLFSIAPIESFWGTYERLQGMLIYLYYFAHFFICLHLFSFKKMRRYFLMLTVLIGVAVSLYGIAQYFGVDSFTAHAPTTIFGRRIFSTIGNPTQLGQFLIFPFFVCLIYGIESVKKRRFAYGGGLAAACFIILTTMWFAHSRAALIAILVTSVLVGIYKARRSFFILLIVCITLIFSVAAFIFLLKGDTRSMQSRFILWRAAMPLVLERPLFGSGPETSYQTLQKAIPPTLYQFERLSDIPDRTHSEFLDIFLTNGAFGAILYLFNIAALGYFFFKRKLKSTHAIAVFFSIVGYYLSAQLSFSLSTQMIFLIGMWAFLMRELCNFTVKKVTLIRSARVFAVIFLIAAGSFSFNFAYRLAYSDVLFSKFISAYLRGYHEGLKAFSSITEVTPNYSYMYNGFFIFYNDRAKQDESIASALTRYAQEINRITAKSFKYDFAMTQLTQALGKDTEAEAHFAAMQKKAPHWPEAWLWRGRDAYERANYKLAASTLERYMSYAPDYVSRSNTFSERYRIFAISHPQYFEAVKMLERSRCILKGTASQCAVP